MTENKEMPDKISYEEAPSRPAEHKSKAQKKHKRKVKLIIKTALITAVITYLFTAAVYNFLAKSHPDTDVRYLFLPTSSADSTASSEDATDTLKSNLQNMPTLTALRAFFTEDLVYADPDVKNRFRFVTIDRSLPQNDYDASNLVTLDNGEYQYFKDGAVVSHKGIDVSSHQGEIDWTAVKNDGVEFVYIRAGFRGYGSGKLVEDDYFQANIEGAKAAGIPYGVYFFTQAITEEEAREEANFVISLLGDNIPDLPIMCDVEMVDDEDARGDTLTADQRTAVVLAFLERIAEHGLTPGLYMNLNMGGLYLNYSAFANYDIWYANYTTSFYWPYRYKYWQYSYSGTIDGIEGEVDLDLMMP